MPLVGVSFFLTRPRFGGAFLLSITRKCPAGRAGQFPPKKNCALSLGGVTSSYSNPRSPVWFQEADWNKTADRYSF
jgi:hypothetical protein